MPVLAVPGAAVPSLNAAIPAARTTAMPAAPPLAARAARPADAVDVVSLSPDALVHQALDAPVVAMRQLNGLLQEFEQIESFTRTPAPRMLGTLAVDIGTAAQDLGAGVRPLLGATDTPRTPLAPDAAATLHVLVTLAPAVATPDDTRRGSGAQDPSGPRLAGGRSVDAVPRATPPASARASPAPARPGAASPGAASPEADPARADPIRQAREAVLSVLREAAATLGRMRLRLRAAPAPVLTQAARDEAWCEAQIATALGSVDRASHTLAVRPSAGEAGMAALLAALAATSQGGRQALRVAGAVALLACLGAAAWATQEMDLDIARVLTAGGLGVAGLVWAWRRLAGRRVKIEMRQ